jgi:S1-C subfamily serine protease
VFRSRLAPSLAAAALAVLVAPPRPAAGGPPAVELAPETAVGVRLERGARRWAGVVDVPQGTTRLHVLTSSRQNVDVGASRDVVMGRLSDLDHRRLTDSGEERLTVDEPGPGRWHVAVDHPTFARGGAWFEVCVVLEGEGRPVLLDAGEDACEPPSGASGAQTATFAAWLPLDAATWTLEAGGASVRAEDRRGPRTLPTGSDHRHPARVSGLLRLQPMGTVPNEMRFDVQVPSTGEPPILRPGVETEIELGGGNCPEDADFRIVVPEGMPGFEVSVTADPGNDFDIYARLDAKAEGDDEEDDVYSLSTGEEDILLVGGERGVEAGTWYVNVTTTDSDESAGATLLLRTRTKPRAVGSDGAASPPTLAPATWTTGTIRPDINGTAWFHARVPAGAHRLTVQVAEATSDVELILADGGYGRVRARAITDRMDERLEVDLDALRLPPDLPFALGVVNPLSGEPEVRFRIGLAFDGEPALPSDLAMPPYPAPSSANAIERAAMAVVEIIGEDGEGTGVCVTPGGLILTARHIMEEGDGPGVPLQRDGIFISFPYDRSRPPRQTHVARLVAEDAEADLALLQITKDVYGRPLPADPRFAFLATDDAPPVSLADALYVLGYPGAGSERSRTPIIVVRGVVAGVESALSGPGWLKTDAHISPGHSGGPVLDERGRFLGIANATLGKYDQLGLVRPAEAIPAAWRERIRSRGESKAPRPASRNPGDRRR